MNKLLASGVAALTALGMGVMGGAAPARATVDVTAGYRSAGPAIGWTCAATDTDAAATSVVFRSCALEVPAQGIYQDSAALEQTDVLGRVAVSGWAAVGYDGVSPVYVCWSLDVGSSLGTTTESGCTTAQL